MKEKISCDILIKNTSCLLEDFTVGEQLSIAISDGMILEVCSSNEAEERYTAKEVVNEPERLWMPGLIDGHMHTGQQLLKGAVLDELPMIWTRIMLPFESTLTPEKMELSAKLAALEMIKNGTTGFVDSGSYFMEQAAEVYLKSGLRGAISHSAMDQGNFPESIRQTTEEVLETEDRLYEQYHGKGNLKVYYALRALMNCSEKLAIASAERAREKDTSLQAHMNEYAGEVNYTLERFQQRPMEYLSSIGVLDSHFLAAHSLMLSPSEKQLMGEHGVKAVHCPFSNCGKGAPETPDLLNRKICVGLGTDGAAHGGLSLWNEMKIFRSVMNVVWGTKNANPAVMPAKKLLFMATKGGAELLGEKETLGALRAGCKADLISIDWSQPQLFATKNPVNTLLECVCGNDVADSIVGGRLVMRNRCVCTLDEEQIIWQAKKYYASGEVYR